jgi:hypothetical protein
LAWLVFFSSLPSKPAGNRVKIWRRLMKAGALQLKGAVYVLPGTPEHEEFFLWLAGEINGMGGAAAFIRAARVETVADEELVALFEQRKAQDYRPLEERLETLGRKIDAARQQGRAAAAKALRSRHARLTRDFAEARTTDFFDSAAGRGLAARLERAAAALGELAAAGGGPPRGAAIPARSPEAYRGRRWVTRRAPFVDRMASAWLIRTFVDPDAAFDFIADQAVPAAAAGAVAFDLPGGEFTHVADLCTFEVLARSFALKDPALAQIAEIVHELDLKDGRYRRAETAGVEEVLQGVRRSAGGDADALERGIALFDLLYAAKRR